MPDIPGSYESGGVSYLDFEVDIGLGRGREYPISVIRSPAGEARATFRFPFDEPALESHLATLQIALLRSGGTYRRTLSSEEQSVQDFGREMFDALLAGEIRSCYDMSLREARRRGKGLRLKLRIQPPELAALPWEFMYDGRQAEFVSLSRDHPVVRYLELPQAVQPLPVAPPLNILGLVASPTGLAALDVEHEKGRVEAALKDLQASGLVNLTWLEGSTWRDLHRAMRAGPWHIFHFVGHGCFDPESDEGLISLSDTQGAPNFLRATELGRLLADHASLRLVLLNSCEGAKGSSQDIFSSTAAILVRRGIPAVVAMQYAITDRAATEFARAFYEALADGLSVDAAVTEARKAVSLAVPNTVEWGTPLLYMRASDGVIFELPARRASVVRSAPPADREAEARLEALYTDGLSAFWAEEWERAIRSFQAVLAERPDYPNVAAKLEEARRQQKLGALYEQALASEQAGDWAAAESALEILAAEAPDYRDAGARLGATRKQRQLTDLEDQARKLFAAEQWAAVLKVFGQVVALHPEYKDPEGLLATARQKYAELKRRAELDRVYGRAMTEMEGGRWAEALQLLRQVQEQSPGLRDTERLIARAEGELGRVAAAQRREAQIAALYEQAQGLAREGKWRQALAKTDEIRVLAPAFADPLGIGARAARALAEEEAEAQRQSELAALYSEAVQLLHAQQYQAALEKWREVQSRDPRFPDRQKVQATALKKLNELAKAVPPRSAPAHVATVPAQTPTEAPAAVKRRPAISARSIALAAGIIVLVAAAGFGIFRLMGPGTGLPPQAAAPGALVPIELTPAPAATPRVAAEVMPVLPEYDSFANRAYDERINPTRWTLDGDCANFSRPPAQRDGVMEAGNAAPRPLNCGLQVVGPPVPGMELGGFEARIRIRSDDITRHAATYLWIDSPTGDGRDLHIVCGHIGQAMGAQLAFEVLELSPTQAERRIDRGGRPAALDRWYTARLRFDPATLTVSCVVDGEEIGSYTFRDADALRASRFRRRIVLEVEQAAATSFFIDDVRLAPQLGREPEPAIGTSRPVAG